MPEPANTSQLSQAFVLGAGLGTRLKRLTEARPKPLVPVAGKPLITYAFDHLIGVGIQRIVINTHHRAECYQHAFPASRYEQVPLLFRYEPSLLESGGGIKNVENLLGDGPFIAYNGDILTTVPLQPAIEHHLASGNEVTLILRSHGGRLDIAFDSTTGRIPDIGNRLGRAPNSHVFTGIYLISPAFFRRFPLEKVSVIPAFLKMIDEPAGLRAIVIDEGVWWELGTREKYIEVHRTLRAADPDACWVHPTAQVDPTARLTGATYVGAHAKIGPEAHLHDSILWEGTVIAQQSVLTRCIVTENQTACGTHTDIDF